MALNRDFRKEICPKVLIEIAAFIFVCFIIPTVCCFELFVILPSFYEPGSFWYSTHLACGTFVVFNITANYALLVCMDTSIKGILLQPMNKHHYCSKCQVYTPPRSRHCDICDTCILKRDHHCLFTGCCIGHFNYRYFVLCAVYTGWTRTSVTKKYGRYRMLIQSFFINKCVCYLTPLRRYTCFVVASIV